MIMIICLIRQLGMAVAGNTPTTILLTKIGKIQSAGYRLCRIARVARGESNDGLAAETHGHINSAGCEGNESYGCPPLRLEAPV